jgi:hypothetical protein
MFLDANHVMPALIEHHSTPIGQPIDDRQTGTAPLAWQIEVTPDDNFKVRLLLGIFRRL